jgi:hypothetical protein
MTIGVHKASRKLPAATLHERFAIFISNKEFKSQLLIQNLRLDVPVVVFPVLILSDGEMALDPITMSAHSAITVDIDAALKARGKSDSQGVAVVRYQFNTYGAISAVVQTSDYVHRLYLNSIAQSAEDGPYQIYH